MYKDILGDDCDVIPTGGGAAPVDDAKLALDSEFDLLSLDINLGDGVMPNQDGVKPGANGLDLLPVAKHRNVAGVIVVTKARHDPFLRYVIPHGEKLKWTRVRLSKLVDAWFPGRNIIIDKDLDEKDVQTNVRAIQEKMLSEDEIRSLGTRSKSKPKSKQQRLTLQVQGEFDAKGDLRTASAVIFARQQDVVRFTNSNVARLLFELARYRKIFRSIDLPRKEVLRLVKVKQKKEDVGFDRALSAVDTVRRTLTNSGVGVQVVETRQGGGFYLHKDVQVQFRGRVPQVIESPYVVETSDEGAMNDTCIRKKGGKLQRKLLGPDAFLLEMLKEYRRLNAAATATDVLGALQPDSGNTASTLSREEAIALARQAVAEFSRRMLNHHLALDPELLIAEQDGCWLLHEQTEVLRKEPYSQGTPVDLGEMPDDDGGVAGRRMHRGERRAVGQRKRRHSDDA